MLASSLDLKALCEPAAEAKYTSATFVIAARSLSLTEDNSELNVASRSMDAGSNLRLLLEVLAACSEIGIYVRTGPLIASCRRRPCTLAEWREFGTGAVELAELGGYSGERT